jgi:hypothetical protein
VTSPELDNDHVVAICRVLHDHDVAFVIIGGIAARLHDTGHATVDVGICPSRDETNLEAHLCRFGPTTPPTDPARSRVNTRTDRWIRQRVVHPLSIHCPERAGLSRTRRTATPTALPTEPRSSATP